MLGKISNISAVAKQSLYNVYYHNTHKDMYRIIQCHWLLNVVYSYNTHVSVPLSSMVLIGILFVPVPSKQKIFKININQCIV